eukprot:5901413-Amphidinium_carterae.1
MERSSRGVLVHLLCRGMKADTVLMANCGTSGPSKDPPEITGVHMNACHGLCQVRTSCMSMRLFVDRSAQGRALVLGLTE